MSNYRVLQITTSLFLLFVCAEFLGAYSSNSLSLLGDASAMSVDVLSYLCNMYAETRKLASGLNRISERERFMLSIGIPLLSIILLLSVCLYVLYDAFMVLRKPPAVDDVNVDLLFTFSIVNLLIDGLCTSLFLVRSHDIFNESMQLTHMHAFLDSTTVNDEKDIFVHDEIDLEDLSADTPIVLSCCSTYRGEGSTGSTNRIDTNNLHWWNYLYSSSHNSITVCGLQIRNLSINNNTRNLNMMSAFTHVGGDLLRSLSVIIGAIVSTAFGVDGDITDAFSAISVSLIIFIGVVPLLVTIYNELSSFACLGKNSTEGLQQQGYNRVPFTEEAPSTVSK